MIDSIFKLTYLLLFTSITVNLSAQFEINLNGAKSGELDLGLNGIPYIEMKTPSNFTNNIGSTISLYKALLFSKQKTISLNSATYGKYGSITLDAYSDELPLFDNAASTPIPALEHPYAMIRLVRNNNNSNQSNNTFSWNFGVHDNINLSAPPFRDCEDCLTLAYETGGLAAKYVFTFGNDGRILMTSDKRLKKNIEDIQNSSLDKIVQLSPKKYNYLWTIENPKSIGFIAQDVQKIFPDLVSSIVQPNGERTLMLNYVGLIPYITKGMQEQQDIITNQNEKMSELYTLIQQLSEQVKELQGLNKK